MLSWRHSHGDISAIGIGVVLTCIFSRNGRSTLLRASVAIAFAALGLLVGCATSINGLSKSEIATLNIESIEVRYAADAQIWWGNAEREYIASAGARPPAKAHPENTGLPGESSGDATRELADTPEGKAYVREKLAVAIKQRLQRDVQSKFHGTRNVRLEIEVRSYFIPSPLQRVALGGAPNITTISVLRDSKTGVQIAKLERMSNAMAGNGVIGVLVDQGFSDLEDRVLDSYSQDVLTWLTPT